MSRASGGTKASSAPVIIRAIKLCQKHLASSFFFPPFILYGGLYCICYPFDGLEERSKPWLTRYYSSPTPEHLSPPKITASCLLFKVSHQRDGGGEERREAERCLHNSAVRRSKWTVPSTPRHHNGLVESERELLLLEVL